MNKAGIRIKVSGTIARQPAFGHRRPMIVSDFMPRPQLWLRHRSILCVP